MYFSTGAEPLFKAVNASPLANSLERVTAADVVRLEQVAGSANELPELIGHILKVLPSHISHTGRQIHLGALIHSTHNNLDT